MNKYLSLIFLYNKASYKKIILVAAAIPLSFAAIFLLKVGNPYEAGSFMLIEHAFGGLWAVVAFVAAILAGLIAVANALNGKKEMKATHSTTGYTVRRLRISPISSYLTILIYSLAIILIFWGIAIASMYIIGKVGLTITGASGFNTKFALGLLRTEIGQALIPIANPTLIAFNTVSVLALAQECAKSCYLSWHNGRPSFGILPITVLMCLAWINVLKETYLFMVMIMIASYIAVSFGDVVFREKRPKGDPFKANQYSGIMDMNEFEFDNSTYAPVANTFVESKASSSIGQSALVEHGEKSESDDKKHVKKFNIGRIRRRFLPLGINLERANSLLGGCICLGIAEHLVFFFRYKSHFDRITENMKGVSLAPGMEMPYFRDMQENTYWGYIIAVLLVVFVQAYWNYSYYNKKTKSVYVMKRLPDGKEYMRTIWGAPLIEAACILGIMVLHALVDVCIYIFVTPDIALHADYMAHMLPF